MVFCRGLCVLAGPPVGLAACGSCISVYALPYNWMRPPFKSACCGDCSFNYACHCCFALLVLCGMFRGGALCVCLACGTRGVRLGPLVDRVGLCIRHACCAPLPNQCCYHRFTGHVHQRAVCDQLSFVCT